MHYFHDKKESQLGPCRQHHRLSSVDELNYGSLEREVAVDE